MKCSFSLTIFTIIAALCFIAMLVVTFTWMFVPTRIVYQESSLVRTDIHSVEVRQHGHSYYPTPGQTRLIDLIRFYTPIVWFSCFAYLFLFTAFGGFARLRLLRRQKNKEL